MARLRRLGSVLGSVGIGVLVLIGAGLFWWNTCGQGTYREHCRFSAGCRSFYCVAHVERRGRQVPSGGYCTESCTTDAACGEGHRCAVLSASARDDLPPLGKPERACLRVE